MVNRGRAYWGCRLFLLASLISSIAGRAGATSGWGRYQVDIDGSYQLLGMKRGSMALVKLRVYGLPILPPVLSVSGSPHDKTYPGVGPMLQFAVTDTHIFTRHSAWKANNGAPNEPWQIDESREYFFIVRKLDDGVEGPLNNADFAEHPATQIDGLEWKTPRAPGDSPLDGIIMGLVMLLAWLGPFMLFLLPLLAILILLTLSLVVRFVRRLWAGKDTSNGRVA